MLIQHYANKYGGTPPENYERYFVPQIGSPLADDLVTMANLHSGERILDVACGTGIITRLAAIEVGPTGRVDGMDINPAMLKVAKDVVPSASYIHWYEGTMEDMPFADASYDVVTCQMGLQFADDKKKALEEMYRITIPGGRLAINVPGPESPMFEEMKNALAENINEKAAGFMTSVFSLHDPTEIKELLEEAGYKNVTVEHNKKELHLPATKEFLWQYVHSTALSELMTNAKDSSCEKVEQELVKKWKKYEKNKTLHYEQEVTYAIATK